MGGAFLVAMALLGLGAAAPVSPDVRPAAAERPAAGETAAPGPDEPESPAAVAAREAVSRVSRPADPVNPWFLELSHDRRDSRLTMNYQIRWDREDLLRSPREVAAGLGAPMRSLDDGVRGLLQSARLDVYGVRLRPFRALDLGAAPSAAPASGTAGAPRASARRRARGPLDLDPIVADLRSQARRGLRRWMLGSAFDRALPSASAAPHWQKEAVARDLMGLGRTWVDELEDDPAEGVLY